ncbi:MAG: nucleotidyltransferase family protein [Actinomycetota bacterium]|nr:nucleotidyltransferase family protein [Actinomycetota bacterium]MDQ2958103.1 nucleotidyltransferase family protein [Actinomycetota bacterium]
MTGTAMSDRQRLWNALFQSGGLASADAQTLDRLVLLAEEQEVLLPLAEQFLAAPNRTELVAERVAHRRGNHARAVEQLRQVDGALRAAEVPFLMIKGFGYERLQSEDYQRQMDDLDLVLPTVADGWRAVTALAELGYQLIAATVARRPWGWSSVIVVQDADENDVELNCAGLIFHSHSVLGWDPQLWDEQETVRGVGVPGRRWAAAILIAEMLDRPRLRLRDRLDARAVLARLDASDQAWLADLARRYALGWELAAAKDTGSDDVDAEGNRWLRVRRRAPRTFRAVTHAYPMMRPAGLSQAARAAGIAFSRDCLGSRLEDDPDIDEISDRMLTWAGRIATVLNHRPAGSQLAAGVSLPLVPLDSAADRRPAAQAGADGITVYDDGRRLVLDTPIGGFLAVVVPIVDEEQVEQAVAALAGTPKGS